MSQELRDAMVEVGQETAKSDATVDTVVFAYDATTGLMKPVDPKTLGPDNGVKTQAVSLTTTVGAGGDFATINEALNMLSKLKPEYVPGGVTATITLLAGFVITDQVDIVGLDLGWITIVGIDATTSISIPADVLGTQAAFRVTRGTLPVIGQNLTMLAGGLSTNDAFIVAFDSHVSVAPYTTFSADPSVGRTGVVGFGSIVDLEDCIFTGCKAAVIASRNSNINASYIVITGHNGYDYPITASSGSIVNANNSSASGAYVGTADRLARVEDGGILTAKNSVGSLSQTPNEIPSTGSGIIFK